MGIRTAGMRTAFYFDCTVLSDALLEHLTILRNALKWRDHAEV